MRIGRFVYCKEMNLGTVVLAFVFIAWGVGASRASDRPKISGDCTYAGKRLYGRVQIVTSFPDLRAQTVDAFPDLRVQIVKTFPDRCGRWQMVHSFPDLRVQLVDSFPDLRITIVQSFPGPGP
jgi:hypothetical protein